MSEITMHAASCLGAGLVSGTEMALGWGWRRDGVPGLTLAAVCLAGFTTACSGQGPADGTLTGHLYGVGGPATVTAPPSPRPWPGTVTVTGSGVHLDIPVSAGGAYSVRVPPGRYTLAGHSPLYGSGTYLCQAARIATVTSGHTTKADVLCQMA